MIVLQGCLNLWMATLQRQAIDWVTHTLVVEREGERLLGAAIDEETGLRGYLLSQNPASLDPYQTGQTAFRQSFDRLHHLVQDNSSQLQRLNQIKILYDRWHLQFAQQALADSTDETTLAGKTLFDPLRHLVRALLQEEENLLGQRNQRLQELNQLRTTLDRLSLVAILVGISCNLYLLHQRIERPLRRLTRVSEAWRRGHLDVRLNHFSNDEVGQLASVLDAMSVEIRARQQHIEVRNRHLEDLISALSHDLRTPLLATRNTLRPMLNGAFGPVNEIWKEVLDEFHQSNEDLLKLVNALLDISRYEAGGGQNLLQAPLDWETVLSQAIAQVRASTQSSNPIALHISPDLPTVLGDDVEIQRVIQNLLDNALRVSPPDQEIILAINPFGSNQVRVSVQDFGPGITPQEKERLFHRFLQGRGRRGRAGLGLYLCRQIVEAHGGTINVDSCPGISSTFWFTLPVASPNQKPEG